MPVAQRLKELLLGDKETKTETRGQGLETGQKRAFKLPNFQTSDFSLPSLCDGDVLSLRDQQIRHENLFDFIIRNVFARLIRELTK